VLSRKLELDRDRSVATLERNTEALKGENLRLQLQVEEERKARLTLQSKLARRSLSVEQIDELIGFLKRYAGSRVVIERIGDDEAAALESQITEAFRAADWNVTRTGFTVGAPPPYGVIVKWSSARPAPAGPHLLALLRKFSLDATGRVFSPSDVEGLYVEVGLRPTPDIGR
jgi:hypothetical protein